jgi:hypothetical protein
MLDTFQPRMGRKLSARERTTSLARFALKATKNVRPEDGRLSEFVTN